MSRGGGLVLLLAVLAAGCGREEAPAPQGAAGPVIVYSSVDDVFARPVAERFQQETGIEVRLVPDTEETKSTGLLNRLIAEKARPRADVFWSGDPVRAAVLKRHGVSAPYRSPAAADLPPEFSDPEGHWTGFSARARVLIYNRNAIPAEQAPTSIFDLLEPRFRGRSCLANPLFGTTSMHAAALFEALGEERAKAFFEGFRANGGRLVSSNGEVRRRVASGECALGITDTDDANVARLEGKPVGIVFPDAGALDGQSGLGTLVIPNAAVLIAGAPHPEAARRFIDFLLAPATERALAESEAAQIPVRPGLPPPAGMPALADLRPMVVDYGRLAARHEELSRGYLKEWVDRSSG